MGISIIHSGGTGEDEAATWGCSLEVRINDVEGNFVVALVMGNVQRGLAVSVEDGGVGALFCLIFRALSGE